MNLHLARCGLGIGADHIQPKITFRMAAKSQDQTSSQIEPVLTSHPAFTHALSPLLPASNFQKRMHLDSATEEDIVILTSSGVSTVPPGS